MYTCCGKRDCAVDKVSLDPELLPESKMDATWNTPQSLHNSSSGESFFAASIVGVDAISKVDGAIDVGDERLISLVDEDVIRVDVAGAMSVVVEDAISVDEAGAIYVVDEEAIGVDEAGAISVVDEDSTPEFLAGARVEGRKTPHLLR